MDALDAEVNDIPALADALAQAYLGNPLFAWMFAEALTHRLLVNLFTGLLASRISDGPVLKTPDHSGAAIWSPPSTAPTREASVASRDKRATALRTLSEHRPERRHMYLAAVGVRPAVRRRGLASSLLAPVLARCDAEALDIYLENSDPKNTSFYRSHGFEESSALPMPADCPPVVAMVRYPSR